MGDSLGISSAVAPEPGNVPMRSCSLMMMYESPPISTSVHPMPNLLYSTVLPSSRCSQSGPSAVMSPVRAKSDRECESGDKSSARGRGRGRGAQRESLQGPAARGGFRDLKNASPKLARANTVTRTLERARRTGFRSGQIVVARVGGRTGRGLALRGLGEDDAARGGRLGLGDLHEHLIADGGNLRRGGRG